MQRDVALDDDAPPVVDPALRNATRLREGPWSAEIDYAIGAGWVSFADDELLGVPAELERGNTTIALVTTPSREPTRRHAPELFSLWLVRVEQRTTPDGEPEYRRIGGIRLYTDAMESMESLEMPQYDCQADETELRARDIDGDGEVEVTVIAAYLQPTREEIGGGAPEECGVVAFVVGLDDWNVQASFTREYALNGFAASIEVGQYRSTVWRLGDSNGDGHADLHVVQRWRFLDRFMGDYIGDGETAAASRDAGSDRRELDCLYDATADAWTCPTTSPPGRLLFEDPSTRHARRAQRPW